VVGAVGAIPLPRAALAQEEPEALIRQGVELRRKGQNALAQGYFKRAYAIAHTPRSAAQLGLVEHALGYFAALVRAPGRGGGWSLQLPTDRKRTPVSSRIQPALRLEAQ
jgi:hypothetical protein